MNPESGIRPVEATPATPLVWVLLGHRAGDNAQLIALADGLGWPFETKHLGYRRSELATNLLFDATLLGRARGRSDALEPPWPDLVLSAGRRSEPVARWIQRHADRPPKLVHVGRPWRDPKRFDLVITTPQYEVPTQDGVVRNLLPLHGVTRARLGAAAARWRPRLVDLPRPRAALLVGGSSELFTLDSRTGARLAREAAATVRSAGGSLLVTTSARTPRRAIAALREAIDVPFQLFEWSTDAAENPYWGYLALADSFIVTGDSVSMLSEACATGKPVAIFDPGRLRAGLLSDARARLRGRVFNFGVRRLSRDIRRVHDELVQRNHATYLGEPAGGAVRPPPDPIEPSVERVRALFEGPASSPALGSNDLPRVWALLCERAGDNSQILSLAEALGWPFEVKRVAHRRFGRLLDVWRGTTLLAIRRAESDPLDPPWPDVVLSASMQNEPVCRWIRAQSGGRTRYVHIGKPWARFATFDLVITVPEYRWVPQLPNILHNPCSLHRVSPETLEREADAWSAAVAELPRPFITLLVGGYAGPYPFDRANAQRLGRETSAMARKVGGSLLVTTSSRTSEAAVEALESAIDVPHRLYRWTHASDANPFLGFLGLADSIVVTCDSTSMLAEACATRKPVYIFDLGADVSRHATVWNRCNADRIRAFLYRNVLLRVAPGKIRRDIGRVHEKLIASRRAVWMGDEFPSWTPPPFDAMPESLRRVRALVDRSEPAAEAGFEPAARLPRRADRVRPRTDRRDGDRPAPTVPA